MSLEDTLLAAAGSGRTIGCAKAHSIALGLGVPPSTLRSVADRLGVRIVECQLGLFGYSIPHTPDDKQLEVGANVPHDLVQKLKHRSGGSLSCAEAWAIAKDCGVDRRTVGAVADAMGIHLTNCQLGCF